MSNYNNDNNGQSRQWQPRGNQTPQGGGGYNGGGQNQGGQGSWNKSYENGSPLGDQYQKRTGKSTMKKPTQRDGICRTGGHPIPAGTVGVRLDYDNRDANNQALMECPQHVEEFFAKYKNQNGGGYNNGGGSPSQSQGEATINDAFGDNSRQWQPSNDGNGTF